MDFFYSSSNKKVIVSTHVKSLPHIKNEPQSFCPIILLVSVCFQKGENALKGEQTKEEPLEQHKQMEQ